MTSSRPSPRLLIRLSLLAAGFAAGAAWAEPEPLDAVVERLARQGHAVLFSTDVVDPATSLELAADTPGALMDALAPLGLTLKRAGGQWVVSRVDTPPVTSPATPGETLVEHPAPVENVIVTGSRHRLAGRQVTGSVTTLEAEQLAAAPTLGSDALRAVVQLPGMATLGVSATPRSRGGLQDELLVRLDGVELLDAYHLADFQSIFSLVDDRAVTAVDVYTGGFPARYGNRMSGVMEITTGRPAGRPDGAPRTELGASLFSVMANTHGALNHGDTEYLASFRRSTLDQIAKRFEPELGRPRYYDAFGRIEQALEPGKHLSVGALLSKDDVVLRDEDETFAQSDIDSRYLWSRLAVEHGERLSSASTLAYTWSSRRKKLTEADDDSAQGGSLEYLQQLREVEVRSDFVLDLDPALIEFGGELQYARTRYDSRLLVNRGLLGPMLGGAIVDRHDIELDPDGFAGGAYFSAEIPVAAGLVLQPGLRWDFQDYDPRGATEQLSPRLGLLWEATPTLSLRADLGRFHQPEAIYELPVTDGVSRFSRPQAADHLVVGLDWLGPDGWHVRAEAYHKRYRNPKRRFENLFNPFILVPELEADRIGIAPERARARGFDLELGRRLGEHGRASARYGYLEAEDRLGGEWVPRRWSQEHTASASLGWQRHDFSAVLSLTWHSGWRGARLPEQLPRAAVLDVETLISNRVLRDYVSVDASVRRTWQLGRSEITAFASVTNLTSRNNVGGIEYEAVPDGGLVRLEPEREYLMPLVPSLGLLIAF